MAPVTRHLSNPLWPTRDVHWHFKVVIRFETWSWPETVFRFFFGVILKESERVILLHDNAKLHTANTTQHLHQKFQWVGRKHPAYSPDLALRDFLSLSCPKVAPVRCSLYVGTRMWKLLKQCDCITKGMNCLCHGRSSHPFSHRTNTSLQLRFPVSYSNVQPSFLNCLIGVWRHSCHTEQS